MAEQTFRSPGFFEQEIDLSARQASPLGIPAGIIGTADRGPAFVPVTVGTFADFETRFGTLNSDRFGPYAVREFLKHRNAVTFIRVLGAGANETGTDISNTETKGTVKNAGFKVVGTQLAKDGLVGHLGVTQFLCGRHVLRNDGNGTELNGYPIYSDNDSFAERLSGGDNMVNLIRGVLFTSTGSRFEVLNHNQTWANHITARTSKAIFGSGSAAEEGFFKLALTSSSGASWSNHESAPGVKIYTASMNPTSKNYIGKILNTDPDKFQEEEHLLYLDYAVEDELAYLSDNSVNASIALLSGSTATSNSGGETSTAMTDLFGKFDTRYQAPKTTKIISQPYGSAEFDLFHFECISDGVAANEAFKISIANIRKSSDPQNDYGTFDVQLRAYSDTDQNPQILEYYPECSLNPNDDSYVARKIGDKSVKYNFDADAVDERRLVIRGKYPNKSHRIRVVMVDAVERDEVPQSALPFGFRGVPVLKTNNTLADNLSTSLKDRFGRAHGHVDSANTQRIAGAYGALGTSGIISGSIVPPLPMRFKVTRGKLSTSSDWVGHKGANERVDTRLYWGVKFERLPVSSSADAGSVGEAIMNSNVSALPNPLVKAYARFQGISKLDTLVTGAAADDFNNNKFSLARVALYNQLQSNHITHVSGTAKDHMVEASYIRNGVPNSVDYTLSDQIRTGRITMATLVHSASTVFNRFQEYNKFNVMFYGGFDGVNILDRDNRLLNDKASSSDSGGKAGSTFNGGLGLKSTNNAGMSGKGKVNNIVNSYQVATRIMTDPMASNMNILAIPGMRDTFVTDFALDKVKDYGMAIYLMDLLNYDADASRLFDDSSKKVDVRETAEQFESRAINNNYTATYFPDVYLQDPVANRPVKMPASIAAIGALAYNDKVAYPWFAPAGFNRGALSDVANVTCRLNSADRDTLYDARINPIAVFPTGGFVIFGQKTLQMAKSALDRVNVRRMLLEVKRLVSGVANKLLFEQNNGQTRARFVNKVTPLLALVQAQAGIEKFSVICDDTNNGAEDLETNKMNGRIVVVPTRAVEFIAIDFIITNSGVSFE
jgi:hypothetical protein